MYIFEEKLLGIISHISRNPTRPNIAQNKPINTHNCSIRDLETSK